MGTGTSENGEHGGDGLDVLLPVVARWFRATYGTPTPPQRRGWPSVAAGQNTLILAPTGSGKTLAAFLACLDHLWRVPRTSRGVRIVYISPLKALNQDVARNLQGPLEGILSQGEARGIAAAASERGGPERRHAPGGPATAGPQAPRHPDHNARVAAPDAHEPGAGDPAARSRTSSSTRSTRSAPTNAGSSWRSCSNGSRR